MIQAKGIAAFAPDKPLGPHAFERRAPKPDDVVIDIKFCGICHSDIHQARSQWGASRYPMVPGHEIAGVVSQVGANVTKFKVGAHVGVGCFVDSCRECSPCQADLNQYCADGITSTYNDVERDGHTPTMGGYSDKIVVNQDYVLRIPDSLPLDKAAPLLCAGITLYSPLTHWHAGPGKKVAIMGLGGLGHMGVKIASQLGADVTVLSQSAHKKDEALRMGAQHFVNTKDADTFKKLKGHFDLIINTISAEVDMNAYLSLLALDGTLVAIGVPERPLSIHPHSLIVQRRSYAGSLIGSIKETQEMLDFCAQHNISPEIELIEPEQINEAYERVIKSDVRYRFVIDIAKL